MAVDRSHSSGSGPPPTAPVGWDTPAHRPPDASELGPSPLVLHGLPPQPGGVRHCNTKCLIAAARPKGVWHVIGP